MNWLKSLSVFVLILLITACMPETSLPIDDISPTSKISSTQIITSTSIPPTAAPIDSHSSTATPQPTVAVDRTDIIHYVVQDGDTLSSIAQTFSLSLDSVLFSNSGISPDDLEPGTTLVIPPVDGFYYTWEDGETLPKIAHQFDVSILSIVDWHGNGLNGRIDEIQPGTTLFIPGGKISYLKWNLGSQSTTP